MLPIHLLRDSIESGCLSTTSASKHAPRLSTVKWRIRAVNVAPGSLRPRLAMDSIPVVAVPPPLRVDGVALEVRNRMCPPLLRGW